MTNFEKIKLMNVDELSKFIETERVCKCCYYTTENCESFKCADGIKKWLEMEIEE